MPLFKNIETNGMRKLSSFSFEKTDDSYTDVFRIIGEILQGDCIYIYIWRCDCRADSQHYWLIWNLY